MDNPFITQTAGQADWDSGLNADFQSIERGYHVTERAGVAINTGNILWLNSGGFFFPFDPNSTDIFPTAMAYTAAASGDSMTALAWGIVRSLNINSPAVPGKPLYVSAFTPGVIVGSYSGADRKIGFGLTGYGVLFNPAKVKDTIPVETTIVTTWTAAAAVNSGHAVWLDPAANTAKHFDPNSESINAGGVALTGGAGVGSLFQVLLSGRLNMSINSAVPLGRLAYVSVLTPGVLVGSYAAASRPIGRNVGSQGIFIDPLAREPFPERLSSSLTVAAVTGSLHLFSMSAGRFGWNRQTVMIGNSADLVELKFFSDSARTNLMYQTVSGGVTTVGSFQDRAGWPYENTDASTLGDLVYGSLKVMSAATVGSDTISIQNQWDRGR